MILCKTLKEMCTTAGLGICWKPSTRHPILLECTTSELYAAHPGDDESLLRNIVLQLGTASIVYTTRDGCLLIDDLMVGIDLK